MSHYKLKFQEALHQISELEKELCFTKLSFRPWYQRVKDFFSRNKKHNCCCVKEEMPKIALFAKITESAIIPSRATNGSVGYDLYVSEDKLVRPGEVVLVPTGIVAIPPKGFHWELTLRSSTPVKKEGIVLGNSIGIIDFDYCGPTDEIKIMLLNTSNWRIHKFAKGEKIAQLILRKNYIPEVKECSLSDLVHMSDRGGFGSTDEKKEK